MLQYLLSGQTDFWSTVFILLSYAVLILVLLPVHEFAHAFAADRQGDPTPRYQGRLTLNPFAHLDLLGSVMLVLCGIGYARPVPVNPRNFKHPRKGMVLTALAGPVSNLLMAAAALGLFRILLLFADDTVIGYAYIMLVQVFAGVNIGLAVFNLLPIPPLDGSRIFEPLLPAKWSYYVSRYQQYITLGVLVLLLTGILDVPLDFLRRTVGGFLCFLFRMPNWFLY